MLLAPATDDHTEGGETPRSRRQARLKAEIFRVSLDLFAQKGYDQVTVEEIAAATDIAKGTFFNYFPTKQHLFHQLAEDRIDELQEILEEEREAGGSTPEKLAHCFVRLSVLLEQRGRLGRDLVLEVMRARSVGDTGEDIVEAVPMPPGMVAWVRAFVEKHHAEEKFVKRRRDKKRIDLKEDGKGDARIRQTADVYRAPGARKGTMH